MILAASNPLRGIRSLSALAPAALAACLIVSCAGLPAENDAPAPEGNATEGTAPQLIEPQMRTRPEITDRNDITVIFSDSALELDPRKSFTADEAQIYTALYEGLFSYNPLTLEPLPAVAESWKLSDDKRTWTFALRASARWWNGDRVGAKDFRDAWISLMDPAKQAPYSSLFDLIAGAKDYRLGKNADAGSVGVKAIDERTLEVTLAEPASFFPSVLCHHSFAPVHPSMLAVLDWSAQPPISNGPYYLAERTDEHLRLVKNAFYWDADRISVERLTIRFVGDGAEASHLWNSGNAQWLAGNIDLDALSDRSGVSVNAMFATHYYYIRSSHAPWNDRRIRRALTIVLPWDEIREGHMLPAPTLIFPIPGYPALEGIKQGEFAEEARGLLAEAGYEGGKGLEALTLRITPSEDSDRIAAIMKRVWEKELGISVRVDIVPFDAYYASLKKDDYVVGSSTWIGDFADPYTFLQMWLADSNLNDARYNDPEYEEIVARSMAQEGAERWKTLSEAEKLLLEGGTVLPISYTPALNVIDTAEIEGWFPNPLDIHPFKYFSYAAFRPLPGVALAPSR